MVPGHLLRGRVAQIQIQTGELKQLSKAMQLCKEEQRIDYQDLESHKPRARTAIRRVIWAIRLCIEHFLAFLLGFVGTAAILFILAIGANLFTKWWLVTEPAIHLVFVNFLYGPQYAVSHAWSVIQVDWDNVKSMNSLAGYVRECLHQAYLQTRH